MYIRLHSVRWCGYSHTSHSGIPGSIAGQSIRISWCKQVALGQVLLQALRLSLVSIIPPLIHKHSFIYDPHYNLSKWQDRLETYLKNYTASHSTIHSHCYEKLRPCLMQLGLFNDADFAHWRLIVQYRIGTDKKTSCHVHYPNIYMQWLRRTTIWPKDRLF
jgi:hypothetical protein